MLTEECPQPGSQPNPGERLPLAAGESAQFLTRVVRFDTLTVQPVNRRWGVLDASAKTPTPWWVRCSGFHLEQRTADDPPPSADPGLIRSGPPTFIGQVAIAWGDLALGAEVVFDVGGGVTVWIPPTRSLTVSVLLPEESARIQGGQVAGVNPINPASGGAFLHQLFGVAAQPSCCDAGIRAATMSVRRDVPAGSSTVIPIPAGATHVTAYDGPITDPGPPIAMRYRFVMFPGPGVIPLAAFPPRTRMVIPRSVATDVQIFGDALNLGRTTLVFELEH